MSITLPQPPAEGATYSLALKIETGVHDLMLQFFSCHDPWIRAEQSCIQIAGTPVFLHSSPQPK